VGTIAQSGVVRRLNPLQTRCRITGAINSHDSAKVELEAKRKNGGRIGGENVDESKKLFSAEAIGSRIVLNLKDLTLVDEHAVIFLKRSEVDGLTPKNCPAYIREWITSLK
jgi:hypothetical protein